MTVVARRPAVLFRGPADSKGLTSLLRSRRTEWSAVPQKSTAWPPVVSPSGGEKRKGGPDLDRELECSLQ